MSMKNQQILEKIDFTFQSPFDSSQEVKVHKNPNYMEMRNVLQKSSYGELRGIVYGKNVVYVWDANLATHDDVINIMSLLNESCWRFIIDTSDEIISASPDISKEDILSSGMIARMLKKQH